MSDTKVIKENFNGGSNVNPIKEIMKKYGIDEKYWYVDSFKIKDGKWTVATPKREQELEWTKEENSKGGTVQIMQGYANRYPEFIVHKNKSYSIEITFKRVPYVEDVVASFERIIKNMPAYPYSNKKPYFKAGSGHAFELSTYDSHFGKQAWLLETGYRNYDMKIAKKDFIYVSEDLLEQAIAYKPEKIFIIFGQDMYHIDNMESRTTYGSHSLDVDGRITKVNDYVFESALHVIYKARELAPVKILWIPGNHDYFASYMLCFALMQHFKDDPHVEVDLRKPEEGKKIHKAELWGNLLVGFTHRIVGKHNTWANELAQAFPDLWAKSTFREWHHGDQHKKQDVKTIPTFTSGGVLCRQLTALSPVDKWHTDNLFTDAVPGGEGFIWHKTKGVRANLIAWTGQYDKYRNLLINKKDDNITNT